MQSLTSFITSLQISLITLASATASTFWHQMKQVPLICKCCLLNILFWNTRRQNKENIS